MKTDRRQQEIDNLVEEYLSYAEALARSLAPRLPIRMEMDEIISLAHMGLIEAARKFDRSRNVSFKTYAYYRIRGAIYDGMRSLGALSRDQTVKYRFQKGMDYYMEQHITAQSNNRTGPRQISLDRFRDVLFTMTSVYLLSLDSTLEHVEITTADSESPYDSVEKSEAVQWLRKGIRSLSEQEQTVITRYYYQQKTLEEIGQELNLSRSWVCRIHARAVKKLQQIYRRALLPGKTAIRA